MSEPVLLEVLCKKTVLRNFAKFTGKHCASVSLLIKLQACCKMAKHTLKILRCEHRKIFKVCLAILQQACNFIKKETLVQVFSCELCKISKNSFS